MTQPEKDTIYREDPSEGMPSGPAPTQTSEQEADECDTGGDADGDHLAGRWRQPCVSALSRPFCPTSSPGRPRAGATGRHGSNPNL